MREYEECEYCRKRATHQRWQPSIGRWVYCKDHAPVDSRPIHWDVDGFRVPMDEEHADGTEAK